MARSSPVLSIYRWLRWPLLLLSVAGLLFFAAWRLTQPDILQGDDFTVYWAAGRLNATWQDPYNAKALFALEREAGRSPEEASAPLLMWNPPCSLVLFTLFGMLPYPFARALWFTLHLIALAWSAERMWVLEGRIRTHRLPIWLLVFTFGPALQSIKVGQISPFLLFSLVAFLDFARRGRWWAAGAVLSLLWLKPQVCYLVLAGVVLQAVRHRRWPLVIGLVGIPLAATLLVGLMNPAAIAGSFQAMLENPAKEQATPTPGAWLRFFLGLEKTWLQFLPSVLGLLWLLWDILRRPGEEGWDERLPRWVLVSLLTMPYGWIHDHIVALIALIPPALCLGWRPRVPLWWGLWASYIVVNAVLLFIGMDQFWYIWLAPFWLLWVAMARRLTQQALMEVVP